MGQMVKNSVFIVHGEWMGKRVIIFLICLVSDLYANSGLDKNCTIYKGMCDASAAVAVDSNRFIVANDEDNILRLYRGDLAGEPVQSFDLTAYLDIEVDNKNPEVDIEGATGRDGIIYWIGSHGRNKKGQFRPNRYRIFATAVEHEDARLKLTVVGHVYKHLIQDLIKAPQFRDLDIFNPSQLDRGENKVLAPDKEGINIEGLSLSADGESLWIGFRNPLPGNKVLIVVLQNPRAVIFKQEDPVFADPVLLSFGGLGIRSIEYHPYLSAYLIIAGSEDNQRPPLLYRWTGRREDSPEIMKESAIFKEWVDFNPEAFFIYPGTTGIQLLSDDGDMPINNRKVGKKKNKLKNCRCKDLPDTKMKYFRGMRVEID
jgi:hypothetical protein